MVGQYKLLESINKYNLDTFPHSCILVGEKGCGKHTLVQYISENILKIPALDISDLLSAELIDNIYRTASPNIYFIDLNKITEKEQNVLLKFIEEPLKNSFVILMCENKNYVLNTIINRCVSFNFSSYSAEELKGFTTEEIPENILVNILKTPGNVKNTPVVKLNEITTLCDKIINKINVASFANTLTIKDKINFKDEYDKFDLNIFLNILGNFMYNQFLNTNNINTLNMYKTLENQRKSMLDKRLNKELWFTNLLIKLWKGSRYGYQGIEE